MCQMFHRSIPQRSKVFNLNLRLYQNGLVIQFNPSIHFLVLIKTINSEQLRRSLGTNHGHMAVPLPVSKWNSPVTPSVTSETCTPLGWRGSCVLCSSLVRKEAAKERS